MKIWEKKISFNNSTSRSFLAFVLGCIASLGLEPYNLFFLTLFSFALALFFLDRVSESQQAFRIGFLFGLGFHFCSLYWIAISFKIANFGGYFLGFFAVILLCSFLSIFLALSFYFIKKLGKKNRIIFNSLLAISILSIFDWIKGNILWGFPWTPISVIWAFNENTLAPFSSFGVWTYSLITYSLIVGIYIFTKKKL